MNVLTQSTGRLIRFRKGRGSLKVRILDAKADAVDEGEHPSGAPLPIGRHVRVVVKYQVEGTGYFTPVEKIVTVYVPDGGLHTTEAVSEAAMLLLRGKILTELGWMIIPPLFQYDDVPGHDSSEEPGPSMDRLSDDMYRSLETIGEKIW